MFEPRALNCYVEPELKRDDAFLSEIVWANIFDRFRSFTAPQGVNKGQLLAYI